MPEQFYTEQKESELSPEEEEKLEIQKILFICGGVLGLCIFVLIVLRVLIVVKTVQQKIAKKKAQEAEILRAQLQREPVLSISYKLEC